MRNLLITGAGVDKTAGIEFPLAERLLPELYSFIKGEGADFEKEVRAAIPGLRFDFTKFINAEIDAITSKDQDELRRIVEIINDAILTINNSKSMLKKRGQVIVTLFDKLASIQKSSQIDEETHLLIQEAFGEEYAESDFVIDMHKVSLSDTFKTILKTTLRESLAVSNPISDAMASHLLDIEQLLIQQFLGFYSGKPFIVKQYIYISWCLWGFLVTKQQEVLRSSEGGELPFYANLPDDLSAITLNYTTFLKNHIEGEVIHFHGGLAEYVRMDTRQLLPIENILTLNIIEFARTQISPNLDFSESNVFDQKHVIPSLVPPLKLKPVLSHKYIDLWARASKFVRQADKIVVIGYSFNNADEHFNDILRNGGDKRYDIVAPDAHSDRFIRRMEKVFGISSGSLVNTIVGGLEVKSAGRVRLIAASADQIDFNALFESGQ